MRLSGIVNDALRLVDTDDTPLVANLGKACGNGSRAAPNVQHMVARFKIGNQELGRVVDGAGLVA
ncbi:hypothetical protein HJFPF1_10932 [Paramyrothecium foliicola]|nr:hypothetical protein HJFPF1_10932 [Paramyrothecium foliicola]